MATTEKPKEIRVSIFEHRGQSQLGLHYAHDATIKEHIRKLEGVKWTQTHSCYYIANSPENIRKLINHCRGIVWVDMTGLKSQQGTLKKELASQKTSSRLSEELILRLESFKTWMEQKRYSPQTIRNYCNHLHQFFAFTGVTPYQEVTAEDVRRFNHEVIIQGKLSSSYQRGMTGAIKLFYSHFFGHRMDLEHLEYPIREKTLPIVLSKEEVQKIINNAGNIKHKAMLSLMYSCGLRRSEVLALKLTDLDKDRKVIRIVQAKGKKDRYVPYSDKLRLLLREYYQEWKPKEYLFEGQDGGRYSERSIALVLEHAVERSGIRKRVTLHTLRHSFATHLLEAGTDIRYIQEVLGHNSPREITL